MKLKYIIELVFTHRDDIEDLDLGISYWASQSHNKANPIQRVFNNELARQTFYNKTIKYLNIINSKVFEVYEEG